MNEHKKIALKSIALSMAEIKRDYENFADVDDNLKRSETMKNLAEAYKTVKKA